MQEQQEKQEPPAQSGEKDKKKSNIPYASVTSTFALIISLLSFYIANVREAHSLQLGVVRVGGLTDSNAQADFTTDLILLNRGNRTETVLSIELRYPPSPEDEGGLYSKAVKGPFVLKAGDAIPVQLIDKITMHSFENAATWTGQEGERSAELIVQVRISAISSEGKEIRKKIELNRIIYNELNDEVTFRDKGNEKHLKLIELSQ